MEDFYMYYYVFVRKDLSHADAMCQVSHASALAGKSFALPEGCNLVLLQVADKQALLKVIDLLKLKNIKYEFHDEPDDNLGLTCVATEGIYHEKRRFLSNFPLWKP